MKITITIDDETLCKQTTTFTYSQPAFKKPIYVDINPIILVVEVKFRPDFSHHSKYFIKALKRYTGISNLRKGNGVYYWYRKENGEIEYKTSGKTVQEAIDNFEKNYGCDKFNKHPWYTFTFHLPQN